MPVTGAFAARVAEVATSTTLGGAYTDVERVNSPRFSGTLKTADSSSNDSGGAEENVPTWESAQLTFEMVADEGATGQEAIWTSFLNKTQLFYKLRPTGVSSTNKQIRFAGTVTGMEEPLDKADVGKYNVTVLKTGAITRDAQP